MWLLTLKLTLVPLLIWGISAAGRIWGPSVAGWLSAFPVVTGPILFFICAEQGPAFAADAAGATLGAILAHLAFGLAYAWAATRWQWGVALVVGLAGYAVCLLALSVAALPLHVILPVVLGVLLVARRAFPELSPGHQLAGRADHRPALNPTLEMGLRMAAGVLLVLLVTGIAAGAGPRWSGLLAMFPVLGVVLAVFSHRQSGAAFTVALLRNMVWGYFAFGTFCVLLAEALKAQGMALSFAMATIAALAVQGGSLTLLRRSAA